MIASSLFLTLPLLSACPQHLSACLPAYLPAYLPACLSAYLPIYLPVRRIVPVYTLRHITYIRLPAAAAVPKTLRRYARESSITKEQREGQEGKDMSGGRTVRKKHVVSTALSDRLAQRVEDQWLVVSRQAAI